MNANNNYLQFKYFTYPPVDVEIDPGNYSMRGLNDAIVAKTNQAFNEGLGEIFVAVYDNKTNTIGIQLHSAIILGGAAGLTFQIYTDSQITDPAKRRRSVNSLLKNFTPTTLEGDEVFSSGFVDM